MRRRLVLVMVAGAVLTAVVPLFGADPKPQPKLKPEADLPNLPGSFNVYAVTGEHAKHFTSPVCDYGLHPLVLVFLRDRTNDIITRPVTKLLQNLDKVITDHPLALAGGCAIVLNDYGYRQALESKTDDLLRAMRDRDSAATALRNLSSALGLKHITFALEQHAGPKGYDISDKATVTVLVCYRGRIEGRYVFDHSVGSADEGTLKKIVQQFDGIAKKVQDQIRPPRRRRR